MKKYLHYLVLLAIPLIIYLWAMYFKSSYYVAALLIIIVAILPFFIGFERKQHNSKKLVLLCVMIAIAVISRGVFFFTANIKPITCFVILAGIALGAEYGFVCGTLSAFISNFLFSQGPWTPFQMIGLALLGFIAGLIFKQYTSQKSIIPIVIYGALSSIFIYGVIADSSSLLYLSDAISFEALIATYIAGVPFNIMHAIGTAVFLTLLTKPITKKFERLKLKYGF